MNYNTERCKTVSLVAVNDKPLVISTHHKLISIHFFLHLSSSCNTDVRAIAIIISSIIKIHESNIRSCFVYIFGDFAN